VDKHSVSGRDNDVLKPMKSDLRSSGSSSSFAAARADVPLNA
jgi:hypothetical protein